MEDKDILDYVLSIPEESETIEFKRLGREEGVVRKIIQTVVAMCNTHGGSIIIGVDDPEKTKLKGIQRIYGIEENQEVYDEISREVQKILPSTVIKDSICFNEPSVNKTICILRVPKCEDQLRSINNEVRVRLTKGNKRLSPQEIINYSYAKGFTKADNELVDVDFDLLKTEYYESWKSARNLNIPDIENTLFQTGLARKNDKGVLRPTRAAVLLFANFPTTIMDTKCAIRVLQYAGNIETYQETPNLISVPKTIDGPVVKLIRDAHDYVLTLLRTGITIPSGFKTKYQIPERAIKEAITNAVIHRDYHIKRDIEIKIFEDRVEIDSPGLLPFNITPRNIGFVRADGYRNDLIVKHLREFPQPPNLDQNEGVRAMRNEMKSNNLYPPYYVTYPTVKDAVSVILFNESAPNERDKLLEYFKGNTYLDNETARGVTGTTQVHKMSEKLKIWTKKGLLIRIPADPNIKKGVKYKLSSSTGIEEQSYLP